MTAPAHTDHVQTARELDEMLASLQAELSRVAEPEHLALQTLGLTLRGFVKAPYSDEAFWIWTDALRTEPGNLRTIHHLAIMYHARAIDREAGPSPHLADADWQQSLKLWHQLWSADAFWAELVETTCKGASKAELEAVTALRGQFPVLLLRLHYDIALWSNTSGVRAKDHLRLAAESAFPAKYREAAQEQVYREFLAAHIEDQAVWQSSNLDKIKQATAIIESYLQRDKECVPAVVDVLRFQMRLLWAQATNLRALGDEEKAKRSSLLRELRDSGRHWRKYFDPLAAGTGRLDEEAAEQLCDWYRLMGDIHFALKEEGDAVEFYRTGAGLALADPDRPRDCARMMGQTMAYIARDKAHADEAGARAYCDGVFALPELSLLGHLHLAEAYHVLDAFDRAEEVCRRGLELEPEGSDPEALELHQQGRDALTKMLRVVRSGRYIHQVTELIKQKKFAEAVKVLNAALAAIPDDAHFYFLRCQCHMSLNRLTEARADLERFKALADSPEARAAAVRLEEDLESVAVGGFFSKAAELMKKDRFAEALDVLNEAQQQAPDEATCYFLRCQCYLALFQPAQAEADLRQFRLLAGDSPQEREAADRLAQDLESLRRIVQEFGTREAVELHRKALKAFSDKRMTEAVRLLRQALLASGGREVPTGRSSPWPSSRIIGGAAKLREELSLVLMGAAVEKVNAAGRFAGTLTLDEAEAMLREAIDLDPANREASTNLDILTRNRRGF